MGVINKALSARQVHKEPLWGHTRTPETRIEAAEPSPLPRLAAVETGLAFS